MKRVTLVLLVVVLTAACTHATGPAPELDCVPPGPEADWCHHLDNDVAWDTLLTYPDSLDPATGLPWGTSH